MTGMPVTLDQDFIHDPYTLYQRLRTEAPVTRITLPRGLGAWLVTRYEDARVALAEPTLSKDPVGARELFPRRDEAAAPYMEQLDGHMLNSDPPDHTRMRKLVNKAFTAGTVDRLRPRIAEIAAGLLDEMAGKDEVDLLDAYAFPLPITVICELLGVPQGDRDDFRQWSNVMLSAVEWPKVAAASQSMARYLAELIESKRAAPGQDLMTDLIGATEDGDRLSHPELVAMAFLLLVAGHETTVNLIGNAVFALLRNPEQLAALRADPELLPGAVEEFLRYESPVHLSTIRYTTEPFQVGGVRIPEGQFLLVSLCSANRDTERFAGGDTLDVTRKATGHLAFGHGIHYCLGAPLARLEGRLAIGALLERFPDLALAADPAELRWRFSTLLRGLERLPVRLRRASSAT
jgi:cytochrome P450